MTTISDWQKQVHRNSKDHGWWDGVPDKDPSVIPEKIALIHSEASEALECYRNLSNPTQSLYEDEDGLSDQPVREPPPFSNESPRLRKPVGMDSELADIVIRVMDLSEHLGIDLERAIREKHEFNKTRPQRHGGKRC